MDDLSIIELFFQRSEKAITEIKLKYNTLCMKIANSILLNYEDSEECLNTSYLKIWNAVPPKRPDSLCGYLCRIVRNTALTLYKATSRRSFFEKYEELSEIYRFGETVEEIMDSNMLGDYINEFLKKENPKTRHIFILRYYFNMAVKDIADSFEMSEQAVSSRLMRARNNLRKFLSEKGVEV